MTTPKFLSNNVIVAPRPDPFSLCKRHGLQNCQNTCIGTSCIKGYTCVTIVPLSILPYPFHVIFRNFLWYSEGQKSLELVHHNQAGLCTSMQECSVQPIYICLGPMTMAEAIKLMYPHTLKSRNLLNHTTIENHSFASRNYMKCP